MRNHRSPLHWLSGLILLALLAFTVTPALAKAVKKTFQVPATLQWYNTRLKVTAGQVITIEASGRASTLKTAKSAESGPNGQKYICGREKNAPPPCALNYSKYGALVGKIGPNAAFFIGKKLTFTAKYTGYLYLSVNDNLKYYSDNKGGYKVVVSIP
jgi:hypothetical protein